MRQLTINTWPSRKLPQNAKIVALKIPKIAANLQHDELLINIPPLTVPRTHNRFGDRSFAAAGPRLWNSLPISLRQISSYGQFRRNLKIIYLGFEKSQRSVTHDSLRYINILTDLYYCSSTEAQSCVCHAVLRKIRKILKPQCNSVST